MDKLSTELAQQIEHITDDQLDALILLVTRRFHQLRPEQEGFFLSLPQDPEKRNEALKKLVQTLRLPQNKA